LLRLGGPAKVEFHFYQVFISVIKNISTISYETIIAKEGVFNNGIVSLQCMYQPQVKAYGQGGLIRIEK